MDATIRDHICDETVMFEYDVLDMRRAVDWYRENLGLEVAYRGGDCHTEFSLPVRGTRLALSLAPEGKIIHKAARLFLRTNDLDVVEACLRARGVKTGPKEDVDGVVRILWVEDSEGNHFAIEQWIRRG